MPPCLFAAQKANNSTTRLTFLFSSESFDQFIMRLRYMKQYSETRKLQAEQIIEVQDELSGHVKEIKVRREEKNKLLDEQVAATQSLTGLKQATEFSRSITGERREKIEKGLSGNQESCGTSG